ncbi:MAG: GT4 family glycosyltransferase PelF [Candidatus Omnitrophica bacterium]|nr:GT4 family glycosyltransferase PelF [Candidatus Omnitrophota bacterium]
MNCLQILPELNVGGVETGTLDLARHLVKLGHKAVVVSAGGPMVKDIQAAGAVHYQLPVHKKSLWVMFKMIPALADIIKKEKIDIVHARSRVPAWIAYFACRRTKAVFITTCHGYYKKHLFSYVMGWSKRVIALSNIIARHMIEDFDVPVERVRIIARSVDASRFSYQNPDEKRKEEFNIGIIGRITPLKGHLHFIKAMAKVSRSIPRLKIWIVGDAPAQKQAYKEQVQVLVRRLGLWHCTEFLGVQRNIPEIMSQLDLVVLATTTHEAFGRVIIEAQAAGVPVVATEVGGVVDIIENNVNGLLVPAQDSSAMAEAVLRIFKDKALARTLAENAYKKVLEKYNVELMVKNTLAVYEEALNSFKILILKFSSLGDIILSTAGIRAIRERFAEHYKISFLVGEECKDVLLRCPYIDELLVADFKGKDSGFKGLWNMGRLLRKKNFDIVVDLQNNRASHILARLSASLNRYGYDNKKLGFLLNYRIKDDKPPIGPVEHQFRILKLLGIDLKDAHLEIWPSHGSRRLCLSPAKLCEELGYRDMRVVLTGTQADAPAAESLIGMVKNTKLINACGKTTVNQLACLIKKCAAYVSADSSPLHVAAAVNTPFVALFGPTDPRRHMPPANDYVLIKKDLPCSPCYKSKCKKKKCVELITPEEVMQAILKIIK